MCEFDFCAQKLANVLIGSVRYSVEEATVVAAVGGAGAGAGTGSGGGTGAGAGEVKIYGVLHVALHQLLHHTKFTRSCALAVLLSLLN